MLPQIEAQTAIKSNEQNAAFSNSAIKPYRRHPTTPKILSTQNIFSGSGCDEG